MRIAMFVVVAVALGCGSVNERQECASSTDCPVGEFCTHEGGERFCWPDADPPAVGSAVATCSPAPCVRDGTLDVTASVTDGEEVLGVTVTLDLGGPPVEMTRGTGNAWTARVPLRAQPFGAFERDVVVTVTARDGARNASDPLAATPIRVTRLRWVHDAGVPMTSPAVMDDGTMVVGLSRASEQLLAVRPDGTTSWTLTIPGNGFVTAAPAIGERAIWVGSEDGNLYGVRLDGTGLLPGVSVNTGGAVRGSIAVRSEATKEWAFGASESRRLGAASTGGDPGQLTGAFDPYVSGPVVGRDGKIYAATDTATATLRSHAFDGGFTSSWSVSVGGNVQAPLSVSSSGSVWTGSLNGALHRTSEAGAATALPALPGSVVGSSLVLADGSVVVGDTSGVLHRIDASDAYVWVPAPNLGAPVLSPLVLTGSAFLVPTTAGSIHLLRDDGSTAWSHPLAAGVSLRAPNIHTPAGQAAPVMSTAYFSAANGKLFAVVVDGALDGTAPWPKAFHDPRNTSRAGPQP